MSMSDQQYVNWGVAEFVADPLFQDWISGTGNAGKLNDHWLKVQARYPELTSVMQEAAAFIRELRGQAPLQDNEGEVLVWQAIQEEIRHAKQPAIKGRLVRWPAVAAVAGIILVLGVVAHVLWLHPTEKQVTAVTDDHGAFKLISLPDSSKVMLGANSNIRYDESWKKKGPREVWLKGDAHFEVKHLNIKPSAVTENEKFLVHVNDQLEIEVLGTVFNVWNRNGKQKWNLNQEK